MTLTDKIEHIMNGIADDIASCESTEDTDHMLGVGIRNLDQAETELAELIAHRDAGAFYAKDQDGELVLIGPGGDALYRDVERQPDPTWTLEEASGDLADAVEAARALTRTLRTTVKHTSSLVKAIDKWLDKKRAHLDQLTARIATARDRHRQLDRQAELVIDALLQAGSRIDDAA